MSCWPKSLSDLARAEMDMSRTLIEAALGVRPAHLSYPVGDKMSASAREIPDRG